MSFSTSVIFVELEPLSLKYGLTSFQKSLLSATSLTFNLAEYSFCLSYEIQTKNSLMFVFMPVKMGLIFIKNVSEVLIEALFSTLSS